MPPLTPDRSETGLTDMHSHSPPLSPVRDITSNLPVGRMYLATTLYKFNAHNSWHLPAMSWDLVQLFSASNHSFLEVVGNRFFFPGNIIAAYFCLQATGLVLLWWDRAEYFFFSWSLYILRNICLHATTRLACCATICLQTTTLLTSCTTITTMVREQLWTLFDILRNYLCPGNYSLDILCNYMAICPQATTSLWDFA